MKTTVLAIVTVLSASLYSYGQEYRTTRRVVTVLPEQSSFLSRRLHSSLGVESRVNYRVDLPPNTVEWVYSFTTSLNAKDSKPTNLANQLTNVVDPGGTNAVATDAVAVPPGQAAVDVYLCSGENIDIFMQKADKSDTRFQYRMAGSRLNATQGVVPVKMEISKSHTWFLGIKNPGDVDGINVSLEVAAIVEDRVPADKAIAK